MIDDEEELEKMCGKCKNEAKNKKCIACGTKTANEADLNPNFDESKFEELKKMAT